jgi:hypothetical protein
MCSGHGIYPVGTVILKRKYGPNDASGKVTELFTGMRKREAGYNPQGGDWEYFVTSSDGKVMGSTGALATCMACHQGYSSTDYVTRDYFMNPSFVHPQ